MLSLVYSVHYVLDFFTKPALTSINQEDYSVKLVSGFTVASLKCLFKLNVGFKYNKKAVFFLHREQCKERYHTWGLF